MGKGINQELIVKPTLEQIARHGNIFHEPMVYGGVVEDEDYSLANGLPKQLVGGALAAGLLGVMSKSQPSRRQFLKVLGLASAVPLAYSCATAFGVRPTVRHETENFVFDLPDDLSKEAVDYIKEEHELGLKKLEERLRVEQDYGRKIGRKITVGTIPSGANFSNLDRGTIDYNRGGMGSNVRSGSGPYVHEITHHVRGCQVLS